MYEPFWWILGGGLLMSAIALSGSITLILPERTLRKLVLPLVALAAGGLLGGALFHMLPSAVEHSGNQLSIYVWVAVGFSLFFGLEQLLHWHHCHCATVGHKHPLGYLLLLGDGLHNLIGGLAVAGAFLIDARLGVTTWLAAAAHEIPQELGDFGVLVHSGWRPTAALFLNLLSGLTFLVGGMIAYGISARLDVSFLVPFAAGNFIYIAAADLVPQIVRQESWKTTLVNFTALGTGMLSLLGIRLVLPPS
jgi:zinc and cadmium transporter